MKLKLSYFLHFLHFFSRSYDDCDIADVLRLTSNHPPVWRLLFFSNSYFLHISGRIIFKWWFDFHTIFGRNYQTHVDIASPTVWWIFFLLLFSFFFCNSKSKRTMREKKFKFPVMIRWRVCSIQLWAIVDLVLSEALAWIGA